MKEQTINEWEELSQFASRPKWLYRGVKNCNWPMATSLERRLDSAEILPSDRVKVEQGLIREFRRACHQYSAHVPDKEHVLELLALMQHHGAPTRLLDVSYSVYIAVYFALEDVDPVKPCEPDAVVWAINGIWALNEAANLFQGQAAGDTELEDAMHVQFEKYLFGEEREESNRCLFFRTPAVPCVSPINAYRLNERTRMQKGIFLIPGDIEKTFMDNLEAMPGYDIAENVLKLIIPRCNRNEFLKHLFDMNISHTILFPGLDGFARSLGVYTPAYTAKPWIKKTDDGWVPNL